MYLFLKSIYSEFFINNLLKFCFYYFNRVPTVFGLLIIHNHVVLGILVLGFVKILASMCKKHLEQLFLYFFVGLLNRLPYAISDFLVLNVQFFVLFLFYFIIFSIRLCFLFPLSIFYYAPEVSLCFGFNIKPTPTPIAADKTTAELVQRTLDEAMRVTPTVGYTPGALRQPQIVAAFGRHTSDTFRTEGLQYIYEMSILPADSLAVLSRAMNLDEKVFIDVTMIRYKPPQIGISVIYMHKTGKGYTWVLYDFTSKQAFPYSSNEGLILDNLVQNPENIALHKFNDAYHEGLWLNLGDLIIYDTKTDVLNSLELKTISTVNYSRISALVRHSDPLDIKIQLRGQPQVDILQFLEFSKKMNALYTPRVITCDQLEYFNIQPALAKVDVSRLWFHGFQAQYNLSYSLTKMVLSRLKK